MLRLFAFIVCVFFDFFVTTLACSILVPTISTLMAFMHEADSLFSSSCTSAPVDPISSDGFLLSVNDVDESDSCALANSSSRFCKKNNKELGN